MNGPSQLRKARQPAPVLPTVVVIDGAHDTEEKDSDSSATAAFVHYVPMSFSSLHVPKLELLRGTLEAEALVDTTVVEDQPESSRVDAPGVR
jgi:hypothetical protein